MNGNSINVFAPGNLIEQAPGPRPVAAPIGEPVSLVRSISATSASGASRHGVWHCSPGRWRRQVTQAEFCHFLEGEAIFRSDTGEEVRLKAGDAAFFPQDSGGVWEILEPCSKVFLLFDDKQAA